ncbi:MAG TPA: hypothetical protein VF812_13235 [Ktedonobacterales bacterium]
MQRIQQLWSRPISRVAIVALLTVTLLGAVAVPITLKVTSAHASAACQLNSANGSIKHVIYLQFDNTHYNRDNPSVASDLEQMPHLLNFLTQNGTLFTNDHTILISHTAGGILSSLTGLYPDRMGQTVSNSYDYYKNNGIPTYTSSFKYWTDTVDGADDSLPNMVGANQQTVPAPWITFTHAGCNVGGVSAANIELENTSTAPSGDMTRVFGAGSPEWNEAQNPATRAQATTDYVGIAIHCALGASLCDTPHARPDDATTTPGSNGGYQALFGAKYVNPAITGGQACVNATTGAPITDSAGRCGFPGFDGALAQNTLGMVAQMQENGVPVTFAYISDAHDNHTLGRASGPGEADYKAQLASYDTAFATFFSTLASHGIDKSNTLFVVTADEGDHFAGGVGAPQSDGSLAYSHIPCTTLTACPTNQIGEVNAQIGALLPSGEPNYDIHFDSAPTFYVNGPAGQNGPSQTDPALRQLERDVAAAQAVDPYAGGSVHIAQRLADQTEERALHMVNADPKRTPTFTMFGNADFYFQTSKLSGGCAGATVCVNPGYAWNHGDIQHEIGTTWSGWVGPGVQRNGIDSTTWTDHTNLRPTILELVGLKDSYVQDGRVLTEALDTSATPQTLIAHRETVRQLNDFYEQINAPFGQFSMDTLSASTRALASGSASDDSTYTSVESQIATLTTQRDTLATRIKSALNAAAFDGQALNEQQAQTWIDQAQGLLAQAQSLASAS